MKAPAKKRTVAIKSKTPPPPNVRRMKFIEGFVKHGNATQAAKDAGYSERTASVQGSTLLRNPNVSAEIARRMGKTMEKSGLSLERLDREIERLAFCDPRKFYNPDGTLKPVVDLDEDTAATIASVETITKILGRGSKRRSKVTVAKLKTWSKTDALTLAARRLGALQDRVAMSGQVTLEMLVSASYGQPVKLPDDKTIEGEAEEVTEEGHADGQADAPSNGQEGK